MAKSSPFGKHSARSRKPANSRPLGEFELIAQIRQLFAANSAEFVKVGIGDDAAVLSFGGKELVWTIDSSVENVHFRFEWLSDADIGWRSLHAAASDLAAMGAIPVGALSALELPRRFRESRLVKLLEGQRDAAHSLGCPIVGGNLTSAEVLAVTTTLIGHTKRAKLRSSARVGDELWLIGDAGLAAAGLGCLAGGSRGRRGSAVDRCVQAWRRPVALIKHGCALVGQARAVIDISDGLVGDAQHLAEASRVAIELDAEALEAVLADELREVADRLSRPALDLALYGGEDYALLATGSRLKRPAVARRIGQVVDGKGIWWATRGRRRRVPSRGFDHFET